LYQKDTGIRQQLQKLSLVVELYTFLKHNVNTMTE